MANARTKAIFITGGAGGLGDVRGTLIAALALGVVESFGTIYLGAILDRDAIAFVFLILVLMVRPQGRFGRV